MADESEDERREFPEEAQHLREEIARRLNNRVRWGTFRLAREHIALVEVLTFCKYIN